MRISNIKINPKFEYLNSKQILIPKFSKFQTGQFGTLEFRIWDLFRISDLGFRIFAYWVCVLNLWFLIFGFSQTFPCRLCFAEEQFVYNSRGKRDPFAPLVTSEGSYIIDLEEIGSIADIRLEGVAYDPQGRSVAIVNGIVIKEGDMIKGFELLKIEADRIVLSKDGELYMVRLQKEEQ